MSAKSVIRSLARVLGWLTTLAVILIAIAWVASRPPYPDGFYAGQAAENAKPGTLLRSEPFERAMRADARVWRILYTTTRSDGAPTIASATVAVPVAPASVPRPIIAWAHGTTGIAGGCAPSMVSPFANVPAIDDLLREGWAFVATDYAGLGTPGDHAYFIGDDAARNVIDAVRAARALSEANLGGQFAVWGHSQGGHAALWTGMRAGHYASDLTLMGVAALAPASDLSAMLPKIQHSQFGKIISSYLYESYTRRYPEVGDARYVGPLAGVLARDLARRCVGGWGILLSLLQTELLPKGGIFARDPTMGPLGMRLKENTPTSAIPVPVLIAQGAQDDVVLPGMQDEYVRARCAAGQPLDYRTLPDVDHAGIVAPRSVLGPELVAWTRDRFAGRVAPNTCPPR